MSEDKLNLGIKQWAEEDRPREKLLLKGRTALSDAELIAILISSGNDEESAVDLSKRILDASHNNLLELSKLSVNDLKKFRGIGEAKALSIIAALELGKRRQRSSAMEKPIILSSAKAFDYIQASLSDLAHEEFVVLYLNKALKVITHDTLSRGGISGTVADIKIILKSAIEKLATYIIVAHNHPSGNLKPSHQDIELTKKLQEGCKLVDIILNDHLIIGDNEYYSFADHGMM
jgi:DNA repair protein RadC